jgi:ribosomal-protein-alanine N-acetyltransferase
VGYLVARTIKGNDVCEIISIAVHPNFRNRGFALRLLNSLIDFLKKINYKKITLEVSNSNFSAINLYEKYKFKSIGLRKGYYLNNIDASIMALDI